jgi:DNA-binding transcriptional LysR family regulator
MELEFRLLRSFVTVASEGHFGRAAERLNITQPALTRRIHDLEARIGAAVFIRRPRDLELTEAGRVLLGEAERLLAQSRRALERTRRTAHGDSGHLSLGFVASVSDALAQLVRLARERYPGITFTFSERAWLEQSAGLGSGEDDAAFMRDVPPDAPWQRLELVREPLCIVVPHYHPLACHEHVEVEDLRMLADTPFVASRRWMQTRHDQWGFIPQIADEVASLTATYALVRAGIGVSLMPLAYAPDARGVTFVPIVGTITRLELCWGGDNDRPVLERFLEVVREWLASPDAGIPGETGGQQPQGHR